jgi:hypothetical protein
VFEGFLKQPVSLARREERGQDAGILCAQFAGSSVGKCQIRIARSTWVRPTFEMLTVSVPDGSTAVPATIVLQPQEVLSHSYPSLCAHLLPPWFCRLSQPTSEVPKILVFRQVADIHPRIQSNNLTSGIQEIIHIVDYSVVQNLSSYCSKHETSHERFPRQLNKDFILSVLIMHSLTEKTATISQGGLLLPFDKSSLTSDPKQQRVSTASALASVRTGKVAAPLQLQAHTAEAPAPGALIRADTRRCCVVDR